MRRVILLAGWVVALLAGSLHAQLTVYDTASPSPSAGYAEPNSNSPIFGDALTLSQGGPLRKFGFDLFNATVGGNTGTILTGTMTVKFYDNTNPYTGGSLAANDPFMGSFSVGVDFTSAGGLAAGFFTKLTTQDLTSLNVSVPQNIFITQQFTELTGTSTANGTVLSGSNSAEGSSPATVYIDSSATPEGLYTIGTGNLNQFAFSIAIVAPEPASLSLCAVSLAAICARRGRNCYRRA